MTISESRGSLSTQEAQELGDQMEIEVQLMEETHIRAGRRPRTKTLARRCDNCGKAGHNARACQIVVEMSEKAFLTSFNVILGALVEMLGLKSRRSDFVTVARERHSHVGYVNWGIRTYLAFFKVSTISLLGCLA